MNIEDLISQYIDGTLPGDAEAELHHRLAVSPEARRLFRTHIMLRGIARDQRVLHTPAPEVRAKLFERLVQEEGMAARAASPAPVPAVSIAPLQPPAPSPAMRRAEKPERRRRRVLPWLIPTMIAGMLFIVLWNGDPDGAPSGSGEELADGRPGAIQVPSSTATPPAVSPDAGPGRRSSADNLPRVAESAESRPELLADVAPQSGSRMNAARARHTGHERQMPSSLPYPDRAVVSTATVSHESLTSLTREGGSASAENSDQAFSRMAMRHGDVSNGGSGAMAYRQEQASSTVPSLDNGVEDGVRPSPPPPPPPPVLSSGDQSLSSLTLGNLLIEENSFKQLQPPPMGASLFGKGSSHSLASASRSMMDAERDRKIDSPDSTQELRRTMVADPGLESPGPGPLGITIGLQQHSLVSLSNSDMRVQVMLKAGIELGGGDHQVYGLVSGANYRETYSDSLIGVLYDGTVYPPESVGGTGLKAESPQVHESMHNEIWVGGGYRYSREIAKGWRVGVGVWTGAGSHYLRLGSELPVAYQPVQWIRVEILPTIQYTTTHSQRSLTSTTDYQRELRYSEKSQRTRVLEAGNGLNLGIGIGASVLW